MNTALSNPTPSPEASGEGKIISARQNLQQNPLRWVPEGAQALTRPGLNAVVYLTGEKSALAYRGRARKSAWNFGFTSTSDRDQYIERYFESLQRLEAPKRERAEALAAFRTSLKAGDILFGTWGYEQTNVDYYQVLEVIPSGRSVRICKLRSARQERGIGAMSGVEVPIPDAFDGQPMVKRVTPGERCKLDRASLSKWDGRPVLCSWYG